MSASVLARNSNVMMENHANYPAPTSFLAFASVNNRSIVVCGLLTGRPCMRADSSPCHLRGIDEMLRHDIAPKQQA